MFALCKVRLLCALMQSVYMRQNGCIRKAHYITIVLQPVSSGRLSLMQLSDKGGPGCHWRRKSTNNGLICLLVFLTLYSALDFVETFSVLL